MYDEPNLRALERAMSGQPQGWGEFPPGKPSRPLPTQDAGTAPATIPAPQMQTSSLPVAKPGDLPLALPGFWMSLAGIAFAPLRAIRWTFRTPTRACVPLALIVGVLALPLFTTTGVRDARTAEGEQMLGALRNQARMSLAKTQREPWTLTGRLDEGGCEVAALELEGKYYTADPRIELLPDGQARLRAYPRPEYGNEPAIYLTFAWAGDDGMFETIYPGDHR